MLRDSKFGDEYSKYYLFDLFCMFAVSFCVNFICDNIKQLNDCDKVIAFAQYKRYAIHSKNVCMGFSEPVKIMYFNVLLLYIVVYEVIGSHECASHICSLHRVSKHPGILICTVPRLLYYLNYLYS